MRVLGDHTGLSTSQVPRLKLDRGVTCLGWLASHIITPMGNNSLKAGDYQHSGD